MNVSATMSIGNSHIQANDMQQLGRAASPANPSAAKQSGRKVADTVSISVKGNDAKKINASVPDMLVAPKERNTPPPAARILGVNFVV